MDSDDQMIKFALGKRDSQVQYLTIAYPLRQENLCGPLHAFIISKSLRSGDLRKFILLL